jgi:hypothetical protein
MIDALTIQRRQAAAHAAGGAAACGNPECWARPRRGAKAFQKCSRCRGVAYCGAECQKADWRRHKRAECAGCAAAPAPEPAGAGGGPAAPPPVWVHPDLLQYKTAEQYAQQAADMRASLFRQAGLQ